MRATNLKSVTRQALRRWHRDERAHVRAEVYQCYGVSPSGTYRYQAIFPRAYYSTCNGCRLRRGCAKAILNYTIADGGEPGVIALWEREVARLKKMTSKLKLAIRAALYRRLRQQLVKGRKLTGMPCYGACCGYPTKHNWDLALCRGCRYQETCLDLFIRTACILHKSWAIGPLKRERQEWNNEFSKASLWRRGKPLRGEL